MPLDAYRDLDELRAVPFFSGLDVDQLAELAASGRRVVFDAGTVVFEEGDEPDGMYVVLSGTVRVYRRDDDGHEVELTTRERGDFFGEIALIENRPRSASVATIDRSELFVLDRSAFAGLLTRADATLVFDVLAALSRMVRERGDSVWRQELARREVETRMEIERHRALARMVAGVAHELNTPLGIANTAAGIIESRLGAPAVAERIGGDPATSTLVEDALEASGLVRRSVDRAHRLVQTFKQISVGSLSGTIESVDIGAVVADTVELFRLNARLAKLAVEVRDERAAPGSRWTGYPGYLSQVLLNLLTNVERYAYAEGVEGRVEVDLADDGAGDGYVLTVRDFGRGIEPDALGQVFEPFFTTGRSRGGTGLGLTIVHNLVTTALQGTIEIESDVGRGTTVTIRLPDLEREAVRSESQAPLR